MQKVILIAAVSFLGLVASNVFACGGGGYSYGYAPSYGYASYGQSYGYQHYRPSYGYGYGYGYGSYYEEEVQPRNFLERVINSFDVRRFFGGAKRRKAKSRNR